MAKIINASLRVGVVEVAAGQQEQVVLPKWEYRDSMAVETVEEDLP